jgi:hypothetical protein
MPNGREAAKVFINRERIKLLLLLINRRSLILSEIHSVFYPGHFKSMIPYLIVFAVAGIISAGEILFTAGSQGRHKGEQSHCQILFFLISLSSCR